MGQNFEHKDYSKEIKVMQKKLNKLHKGNDGYVEEEEFLKFYDASMNYLDFVNKSHDHFLRALLELHENRFAYEAEQRMLYPIAQGRGMRPICYDTLCAQGRKHELYGILSDYDSPSPILR